MVELFVKTLFKMGQLCGAGILHLKTSTETGVCVPVEYRTSSTDFHGITSAISNCLIQLGFFKRVNSDLKFESRSLFQLKILSLSDLVLLNA